VSGQCGADADAWPRKGFTMNEEAWDPIADADGKCLTCSEAPGPWGIDPATGCCATCLGMGDEERGSR